MGYRILLKGTTVKYAIINKDNQVVNVIVWVNGAFVAPRDHTVVESDGAKIGDLYNPEDGSFTKKSAL